MTDLYASAAHTLDELQPGLALVLAVWVAGFAIVGVLLFLYEALSAITRYTRPILFAVVLAIAAGAALEYVIDGFCRELAAADVRGWAAVRYAAEPARYLFALQVTARALIAFALAACAPAFAVTFLCRDGARRATAVSRRDPVASATSGYTALADSVARRRQKDKAS
jgi:hypothetical protein